MQEQFMEVTMSETKKTRMYYTAMRAMSKHSDFLRSIGFSKDFIRNYSPIHALLVKLAFYAWHKV